MKIHSQPLVVYIITKLELGGAQKVCLSLFNHMPDQDMRSILITGKQGTLAQTVNNTRHTIFLDELTREVGIRTLKNDIAAFFRIIKELRLLKKKYPSLLVHTHSTKAGIMGRWAAFFAGIKNRIHTIHGYGFHPHQNKIVWLLFYVIELITSFITTHFICVSEADARTGSALFPAFKKKFSLIRAAVETSHFYQPAQSLRSLPHDTHEPFIFGTIACFKPQKNLFDLLKAFETVYKENPHVRLEIIGDGILRPAIETWIAHHNLTQVITLHGWQHDVMPFMKKWHAFTLSSLWEGLPCALIEARLLKLPVITYNTGGISEVIHHGINGFVYPQKRWDKLAEGMLIISRNELVYCRMYTHRDNLQQFTQEAMITQHEQLYKKILQKNG